MGSTKNRTRSLKQLTWLAVLFVIGSLVWVYQSRADLNKVKFIRSDGSSTDTFYLEIAKTENERAKGLMFRKSMPKDSGMLFIFPNEENQIFWMKNTYISLDMVFVNQGKKIVGILENVPVLNSSPRQVGKPAKYVIELNAGSIKQMNISVGDTTEFEISK